MGTERRTFGHLLDADVAVLKLDELAEPLGEIASGNCCFGPMEEWTTWLHYLLPRVVPVALRPGSGRLHETLTSALMSVHPAGLEASSRRYREFREDVLRTLGSLIMDASKWREGKVELGRILHAPPQPQATGWGWWDASGDLSCSLFLCLKYLQPSEIVPWASSVFTIEDPHWRMQLLVWLAGARDLLRSPGLQPKDVFMQSPRVDWESSWVISGLYTGNYSPPVDLMPFLPADNKAAFKRFLLETLTPSLLESWIVDAGEIDYLGMEAGTVLGSPEDILSAVREF